MSMLISENIKFNNVLKCTLRNIHTNEIKEIKQSNMVTDYLKGPILDFLASGTTTVKIPIKYGGVGIGSGATSATSIKLTSELDRNPSIYYRINEVGTFSTFFNTAEASGIITEVAFFSGSSAYTSTNTGVMFNRILLSSPITKNNNYTLTIDLDVGF